MKSKVPAAYCALQSCPTATLPKRLRRSIPLIWLSVITALHGCKDNDADWAAVLGGDAGAGGPSGSPSNETDQTSDGSNPSQSDADGGGTAADGTDLTNEPDLTDTTADGTDGSGVNTTASSDGMSSTQNVDSDNGVDTSDSANPTGDATDSATTDGTSDITSDNDTSDTPSAPSDDGAVSPVEGDSCSGHDYILCESFEDTSVQGIPAGWQSVGDEVAVSEEQARGGSRSLKLGQADQGERRITHDAGALTGTHWGRIYYRVDAVPDAFVHSTLVALDGMGPAGVPSEYRPLGTVKHDVTTPDVAGLHNWIFHVQRDPGSDLCTSTCEDTTCACEYGTETGYEWEFDGEWHCIEYFVDGANQSYRFFFEGTERLSFNGTFEDWQGLEYEADLPLSYQTVKVGWNNYTAAPPGFEVYIDDIAFDDERIGCE